MINLDNILNTEVSQLPWEHKLVDNVLHDSILSEITSEINSIKNNIEVLNEQDKCGCVWLNKSGVSQKLINDILDINQKFLKIAPALVGQFNSKNVSNIGYFSVPRFNFTYKGHVEEIHHDGDTSEKSIMMTIYLHPSMSTGTTFYDGSTLFKTSEWTPNRAFLFAPVNNLTWHNFTTETDERITLSFFCEKIENMSYVNKLASDKTAWFYENFNRLVCNV
jgi:hypothetical protein